jgi:hypothetical protein
MSYSPSSITFTCGGGCGRRWTLDARDVDAWPIPTTCRECEDRQRAEFFQHDGNDTKREPNTTTPNKELITT